MKILALDIGGTNIRSAIINGTKPIDYRKVGTPKKKKETIHKLFEIIESYGRTDVICVSTAGFEKNGKLMNCLNNDLDGTQLTKILSSKFKVPVYVENDANCATLAELYYGAGRRKKNFILLTLGTGIGGGAIIDGKLYRGQGGAIEPGSMRIDKEKIFEYWASGNASIRMAHETGMNGTTSFELEERANKGEKKAKAVYDKVGHYLGMGIANLVYIFDPELVIIGGGFSRVKHIYPSMEKSFRKFYTLNPKPKIVKAQFGDDAGLIGAGLLAKRR
jgi:glucokinase